MSLIFKTSTTQRRHSKIFSENDFIALPQSISKGNLWLSCPEGKHHWPHGRNCSDQKTNQINVIKSGRRSFNCAADFASAMVVNAFAVSLVVATLVAVEALKLDCGESVCGLRPLPSFFETENGTVPAQAVRCRLKSKTLRDKCVMDISAILQTVTTDQDVVLYFGALCLTPMQIVFNNSQNVLKKNAILYLQLKGHCSISAKDVSRWGSVTDFRVFYMLENATFLDDNSQTTNSSYEGLENIGSLAFYKTKPHQFPSIFRQYLWPRMAEITLSHLQLTSIPTELNTTMPLLQSLEVSHNNLTEPPPDFPWCNDTLHLPRSIQRTGIGNHHYQFGTTVHPKIYRRFFDLSFNKIEDLSTYEFRGFLNKLALQGNGLKIVGPTCFRGLRGIQIIDLSKNKLKALRSELFHGLSDLLDMKLQYNEISTIPKELFKSQTTIKRIDLDHNQLRFIPRDVFRDLKSLENLHLEYNQITTIDDEAFNIDSNSLRKIYLQNNKINRVPKSLLMQRQTEITDLSSNLLTFQAFDSALEELDMEKFSYQHRETASSPQVRLQENLKMISFANNNFTTINIEGFNNTKRAMFQLLLSVYKIDMTGNPLLCDCKILDLVRWLRNWMRIDARARVRPRHFSSWKCAAPIELKDKAILSVDEDQFKCQRNLKNCPTQCLCFIRALDGTVVVDCKGSNLLIMPRKIPRGQTELHFQNNNIREIPPYPYLENVTALYLTHNKIERLNESTVERFQRIKILFMDSNKLTSLPRNIENVSFATLALHHNFFPCDCKTKWMKNWLQRQQAHIKNINNVLCNSKNAQGQAIYTLPDEEFVCKEDENSSSLKPSIMKEKTFKIIAFTFGGLLALISFIFIAGYKYRGEVKVFMYTHFNWHPFDRIDDSDPSKIYDAFVSYSGSDYQWVLHTLRARLESHDPPYKLCIHDRDFLVGATIQENILNSVDQSKRMVMVLSQNFIKSEWCLLEFRAAHQKVLQDRRNYLIIILFDDVDMAAVDDEIKLYMRTNTYLSVSNKWFWEKLFYALPQLVNRAPRLKTLPGSDCANSGLKSLTEIGFKNEGVNLSEIEDEKKNRQNQATQV